MLVWGFPCLGHAQWWGICRGSRGFTARVLRSTHLHVHFCLFDGAWRLYSPPFPPPLFSGKYVVSIMVPLSFVSVTVPGGCRSQGCHGYPTRSAPVLEAPPSFQAPSPCSSIVDEFKCTLISNVLHLYTLHLECSHEDSFREKHWKQWSKVPAGSLWAIFCDTRQWTTCCRGEHADSCGL